MSENERKEKMAPAIEYLPEELPVPKMWYGPRRRVTVVTGPDTIVEQCHREVTDINKIIGRYRRTGMLPPARHEPRYEDVSNVGELLDVKMQMQQAAEAYDALPEEVRNKFSTEEEFYDYVSELQSKTESEAPDEANAPAETAQVVESPPGQKEDTQPAE